MNNDRILLELAAKAAHIEIRAWNHINYAIIIGQDNKPIGWNPLMDDGDAMRLAVQIRMQINISGGGTEAIKGKFYVHELTSGSEQKYGDKFLATRRAIVCLAAEIGKAIP